VLCNALHQFVTLQQEGPISRIWAESSIDASRPRASSGEKMTLVHEAVGASLERPVVVLADQSLEVVAIEKQILVRRAGRAAEWLNHDPTGIVEPGYGPATEVTVSRCKQRPCMRRFTRLQRCCAP
jgi:hypothetical protein